MDNFENERGGVVGVVVDTFNNGQFRVNSEFELLKLNVLGHIIKKLGDGRLAM